MGTTRRPAPGPRRLGEFADGFPAEPRLVSEYGVSRHAVREALRRLREAGVVVSRRGRPSHLALSRFNLPIGALYSLFATIETAGVEQRSEVLQLTTVTDPEAAARLELAPAAPLAVLRRRRLAGDEPIALDTAWLPAHRPTRSWIATSPAPPSTTN